MKLQVEGIQIQYDGLCILRNVSLALEAGEFVSIVGPSGCGKSTLLHLISGLLPLEGGRVLLNGAESGQNRQQCALMPQDDLLFPWLTVLENVCLYGKIHGNLKEFSRRAMENLPYFGLSGYENRYPHELSGGMRQRAAFLRTALSPSELLLLDEPFAKLDVITREEMQDWLLEIREKLSRTVLLVTHDIEEAIYLSDRLLVLSGRPASIQASFEISETQRNRSWLFDQTALKYQIYRYLKEGAVD